MIWTSSRALSIDSADPIRPGAEHTPADKNRAMSAQAIRRTLRECSLDPVESNHSNVYPPGVHRDWCEWSGHCEICSYQNETPQQKRNGKALRTRDWPRPNRSESNLSSWKQSKDEWNLDEKATKLSVFICSSSSSAVAVQLRKSFRRSSCRIKEKAILQAQHNWPEKVMKSVEKFTTWIPFIRSENTMSARCFQQCFSVKFWRCFWWCTWNAGEWLLRCLQHSGRSRIRRVCLVFQSA